MKKLKWVCPNQNKGISQVRTMDEYCDNGYCNGGRAFALTNDGLEFCSPKCLNEHYGLTKGDDGYWSNDEESDCYEEESDQE